LPAASPQELTRAVHDNLRNLGLDVLEVVNLRIHGQHLVEGSIEAPLTAMLELQRKGLVCHIGLSNVNPRKVAEGRRMAKIVCVQNHYNLIHPVHHRSRICARTSPRINWCFRMKYCRNSKGWPKPGDARALRSCFRRGPVSRRLTRGASVTLASCATR
jgi:hypothetical protein